MAIETIAGEEGMHGSTLCQLQLETFTAQATKLGGFSSSHEAQPEAHKPSPSSQRIRANVVLIFVVFLFRCHLRRVYFIRVTYLARFFICTPMWTTGVWHLTRLQKSKFFVYTFTEQAHRCFSAFDSLNIR